ncbi:MAG: DNA polymerase IV [Treponema sp.]|nr:DNA polymerase IV [Treponema sp.]
MTEVQPWFLHVDLDAFFASVEQLDHPEYRGKPVIVGGLPEDRRSVVSTASYEARVFGVHSAMPIVQAYKLCPNGIYLRGRMKRYAELSYQIMNIFKEFSPDVIQMSIDEAFIDLTGTENLFGPPEETAKKIKAKVKQETGLTVSVGLASTKYLAKIASAMSKPDGFFFIKHGQEQNFMLNLPLKKVWGIGTKTFEALNRAGINTTRDIYEKSLDILQFMYGKNQGEFLYNVVRGKETNSFDHQTKSHSLSAEKTFAYDLTDIYTIETNILEICHGVMFRLLKENGFSKTVMVKIRYEDFSTVTIQHTEEKNILTVDSFYAAAKNLFEQKFERGRGVRLIGVAFENITKDEKPYQQELFDDGSEKKQKVEKAILQLQKKHPEISVHKARLLDNAKKGFKALIPLFILFGFAIFPQKLVAQNYLPEESKSSNNKVLTSLFNLQLSTNNFMEVFASGYWKTSFLFSGASSFGFGNPFALSFSTPIFKQELDLSLFLQINENWYFDFDFIDDYVNNKYSIGYNGSKNLEHFELSNKSISFPDYYSAKNLGFDLNGDKIQSPGMILSFSDYKNKRWKSDFLLRYDMTEQKIATFYGYNSVQDVKISPENYVHTKKFVLPLSQSISSIKDIYIQDSDGQFTDKKGRTYKKLAQNSYLLLPEQNLILLANQKKTGPLLSVLITFNSSADYSAAIESLGSYNDSTTFLGNIQSWFNTNLNEKNKIDLETYSYDFQNQIENMSAFELQNPSGFSPFIIADTYDCGVTDSADIEVCTNSDSDSKNFSAYIDQDTLNFIADDFFTENHTYAVLKLKEYSDDENSNANSDIGSTETSATTANSTLYYTPQLQFPLGAASPQIYLLHKNDSGHYLRLRTYTKVSNFYIGRSAASDSVQVYINDVLDNSATYNHETGYVTTQKTVENTDKIYIIWEEGSSSYQNGSIAAGAGFFYNFSPFLSFDSAITTKWPLATLQTYATKDESSFGFAALTTGLSYKKNDFTAKDELAFYVKNENVSGVFLTESQSVQAEQTFYHSINNASVNGIKDSEISGYAIPLEWDFSDLSTTEQGFAAVEVKLAEGYLLKNSKTFSIALKNTTPNDFTDLYLQLGINADESFSSEIDESIPTWKISDSDASYVIDYFDKQKTGWQTVKIQLTDSQRAHLLNEYDLRLIVTKQKNTDFSDSASSNKGCILIGPYEPTVEPCFIFADNNLNVQTRTEQTSSPSANELEIKKNYSTQISWNSFGTNFSNENFSQDEYKITAIQNFEPSSFASYKTVNLDFMITELDSISYSNSDGDFSNNETSSSASTSTSASNESLIFILDSDSESVYQNGTKALEVCINSTALNSFINQNEIWNVLSVNIQKNTVSINGTELNQSDYTLFIDKTVIPSRKKLIFNTKQNDRIITKGFIYIDNLYYKDTNLSTGIKNKITSEWKKEGSILQIKNFDLLKDAKINLSSEQNVALKNDTTNTNQGTISSTEESSITIAGIKLDNDITANYDSTTPKAKIISNAGHSISTENPVFNFFSFSEKYRYQVNSQNLVSNKKDFIELSFPYTKFSFSATAGKNASYNQQDDTANLKIELPQKLLNFNFNTQFFANQKTTSTQTTQTAQVQTNYFSTWLEDSILQFSPGDENAFIRNSGLNASTGIKIPFAGITPLLQYKIQSTYQNNTFQKLNDYAELKLSVPFKIANNSFSVTLNRKTEGLHSTNNNSNAENSTSIPQTQTFTGSSTYFSDLQNFASYHKEKNWFYTAIPAQDLFSTELSKKVHSSTDDSAIYATSYDFTWNRPLFNSAKDFLIPVSATLAVSRNIRSGENIANTYQIKSSLTNSSLNLFGAKGTKKIFKWYNTDEFSSTITTILSIPKDSPHNTEFQVSLYNSALFYINKTDNIKIGTDFLISTDFDFQANGSFIWNRRVEKLPIEAIVLYFYPSYSDLEKISTRKETLNIKMSRAEGVINTKIQYLHNADIQILKYYTITTGTGGTFSLTQNKSAGISLEFSLGAKMEF